MIPIQDILNRIKWDKKEYPAAYTLYYHDRVLDKLLELKYTDILRIEDNFMIVIREGKETAIPLHRVKIVKKNDAIIWQRSID
jgi:uncharacterized protein (UPF0248 family)